MVGSSSILITQRPLDNRCTRLVQLRATSYYPGDENGSIIRLVKKSTRASRAQKVGIRAVMDGLFVHLDGSLKCPCVDILEPLFHVHTLLFLYLNERSTRILSAY